MKYLIILLIGMIVIILLTCSIYIKPQFTIDENGYHTTITIYVFIKTAKFRIQIGPGGIRKPGSKKGKNDPIKKHGIVEIYDEFKHLLNFYHSAESTIKYIIKKMDIEEIRIITTIGTEDACLTAMAVGFASAVAGIIVSVLTNIFNECKKSICITPHFSGNRFNLNLYCIFKVKFAYIIVAGLKYLTYLLIRRFHKVKHANKKCNC